MDRTQFMSEPYAMTVSVNASEPMLKTETVEVSEP